MSPFCRNVVSGRARLDATFLFFLHIKRPPDRSRGAAIRTPACYNVRRERTSRPAPLPISTKPTSTNSAAEEPVRGNGEFGFCEAVARPIPNIVEVLCAVLFPTPAVVVVATTPVVVVS